MSATLTARQRLNQHMNAMAQTLSAKSLDFLVSEYSKWHQRCLDLDTDPQDHGVDRTTDQAVAFEVRQLVRLEIGMRRVYRPCLDCGLLRWERNRRPPVGFCACDPTHR